MMRRAGDKPINPSVHFMLASDGETARRQGYQDARVGSVR
jgi:hypothetical protein